jgi:hypothetical protein
MGQVIAEFIATEREQCTSSIFTAATSIERLCRTVLYLQAHGRPRCAGYQQVPVEKLVSEF